MRRTNQRGFGIVEAIIAGSIIVILALVLANYIVRTRSSSTVLRNRSVCKDFADSLVQNIRSQQNSLNIRNWMPDTSSASRKGPASDIDPLCTTDGDRVSLCDSVNMFDQSGGTINFSELYLSENVRNSVTWAQNVFNNNNDLICKDAGKTFTGGELAKFGKFFPAGISVPSWVQEASLKIQLFRDGKDVPCSADDAKASIQKPETKFHVTIGLKYKFAQDPQSEATLQSCTSDMTIGYDPDRVAPTITQLDVQNLINEFIDQNDPNLDKRCTCRKLWDPGPCDEMFGVRVTVSSSEPGSIFLCKRKTGPVIDSDFIYCGDLPGGSTQLLDSSGNAVDMTMNQPTRARFMFNSLAEDSVYDMEMIAVDSGGNRSSVRAVKFYVHKPNCPATSVCPNDFPGPGEGPQDGCGNDCPVGILTPTCPNPGSFCGGPVQNSCGTGGCPNGSNCPNPCDPPCPPSDDYCNGQTVKDGCGNNCPSGTKDPLLCGGGEPDITPTPVCVPPTGVTVVNDQSLCCGQGIYYCKESTVKWKKDFAYDRYCCCHGNCSPIFGENMDKKLGGALHACWASNRPTPRCWQINTYVCLGPGTEGKFYADSTCRTYQSMCGVSNFWTHDDLQGGQAPSGGVNCPP